MAASWRKMRRPWATVAAVLGFAMLAVYLSIILSEGNDRPWVVIPWALAMALAAVLALVAGQLDDDRRARTPLLISAVVFLAIGAASIFSVGVGFLAAGLVALFGATQLPR